MRMWHQLTNHGTAVGMLQYERTIHITFFICILIICDNFDYYIYHIKKTHLCCSNQHVTCGCLSASACTCIAAEFTGKLTVYLSSPQFPIKTPGANRCSILQPGMCHFIGSPCAILRVIKTRKLNLQWRYFLQPRCYNVAS